MIQSTGNNFGAGVITFKDYQSEHEIVLNGSFEYLDTTDAYKKADVLEIYLPDLSLSRSAISGCYCAAKGPYAWMGTTAKCWIKNRNTLCIEKLDVWTDRPERKIWIFALFGLRGFHDLQVTHETLKTPQLAQSELLGYVQNKYFYANEHFMLFAFTFSELTFSKPYEKVDLITNADEDFPDDVDAVVPFVTCQCDGKPGCAIIEGRFKDSALLLSGVPKAMSYGTGYVPFFYAWLVRDGGSGPAPDVDGRIRILVTSQIQGSVRYTYIYKVDMDLVDGRVILNGRMTFNLNSNREAYFTVPSIPDGTPSCDAFLLAKHGTADVLSFGLVEVSLNTQLGAKSIKLTNVNNEPYFYAIAKDTGVCATLEFE